MTAHMTAVPGIIRPLRRITDGVWRSRDGRWAFHRHFSDPHPQRWYAYLDDGEGPLNDGQGHTTLREVAEWADGLLLPPLDKPVASLPTAADYDEDDHPLQHAFDLVAHVLHQRPGCDHHTGGPADCDSRAMTAVAALRDAGWLAPRISAEQVDDAARAANVTAWDAEWDASRERYRERERQRVRFYLDALGIEVR